MHQLLRTRVNDFAVKLANVNGTGSASANGLLMQAIFRMGIPVSGKNLFPSNIQGLPTWYEIRVNAQGHTARALAYDLMIAMNSVTYAEDIADVRSGGYVLYDSSWPLDESLSREDVNFLGVPLAKLCLENFSEPRERILMKIVAYAGAVVALLGIEPEVVANLLEETFSRNPKLRESNQRALLLGFDYATEHFTCPLDFRVERLDALGDAILIDGNTATALGALYAGATVAAWYPITPATAVMDNFTRLCAAYRRETTPSDVPGEAPEGRHDYLILQAEDEIAAIGMVLGASWNGARSFTSTSGPGISLMNELIGLAYYTEIPAVIIDVQRAGPSTGMPTRTQQADLLLCADASHGDTRHLLLFPANPRECFEMTVNAFDLAERFQTPVFMMSDLDIGMNDWVVPALTWDDAYVPDRGRVLSDAELAGAAEFFRYADAAAHVPAPVVETRVGARVGVITLGSRDLAVREAIGDLAARGVAADYMRVRGFPFTPEVRAFVEGHETCVVVEQNRDAQLRSLISLETGVALEAMHPILAYGGFPLSAPVVVDGVLSALE